MYQHVLDVLAHRGVMLADIAEIVLLIQKGYYPQLTLEECQQAAQAVLRKREVQHAILVGIAVDQMAEEKHLPEPLQSIIARDDFLFGVDEVLALSITNVYGSIGLTNFGYLDKTKPGVIGHLNNHQGGSCHTFLDDMVSAIAAAAAAKIAHSRSEAH